MSGAGQAGASPADPLAAQRAAEMVALEAFRLVARHEQRAWLRSLRRALDGQPFAENAVQFHRECDQGEAPLLALLPVQAVIQPRGAPQGTPFFYVALSY